jgi:hypothetical protein
MLYTRFHRYRRRQKPLNHQAIQWQVCKRPQCPATCYGLLLGCRPIIILSKVIEIDNNIAPPGVLLMLPGTLVCCWDTEETRYESEVFSNIRRVCSCYLRCYCWRGLRELKPTKQPAHIFLGNKHALVCNIIVYQLTLIRINEMKNKDTCDELPFRGEKPERKG